MAKKKKSAKPAVTPQTQIRRLKKQIKRLEEDNLTMRRCIQDWYKDDWTLEQYLEWEKEEIMPLLENPQALAAALKGPKLMDIIKEHKAHLRMRKKGA